MNPDDIIRLLDELGERIGPPGEYIFTLAVRQVYVDAFTTALMLILYVVASLIAIPRLVRWAQAGDRYDDRVILTGPLGVLWGIGGLFVLMFVFTFLPRVLNPEYFALQSLLERLP